MTDDRDDPRQIDPPQSSWAPGEKVIPWRVSHLPDREQLWQEHIARNWRERNLKPKPPRPPRGIQRRV